MEFRLRRADGVFHTFLTRIRPTRNERGEIVRWYGSNVDIQAQKDTLARTQRVAETLQGVFLPDELPHTDRLRVDAVYVAAEKDALVGGDWFDAVRLRDGRYLVSIGDVAGHGLGASTIAGRLRHAIRDFAARGETPAEVLRCANEILRFEHPEVYATSVVAFIDADCTKFAYASAGHQPPLLARFGAPATVLHDGGLMLGVHDDIELVTRTIQIARDDVLALYTDGLTEFARNVPVAEERIKRAIEKIVGDTALAHPAAVVRDSVLGGAPTVDDAALLIIQFSQVTCETLAFDPTALNKMWRFHSSDAHAAHMARQELMKFVRGFAIDQNAVFIAELILGEILANTVEHAPGLVEIHIDWTAEKPIVTARDSGPGLSSLLSELPADALNENGRGLFLITALAESVGISALKGYGTELKVTLPIRRVVQESVLM